MLTGYIQQKLRGDDFLQGVFVTGEISNFNRHRSGHLYFTLKDAQSQIKCVMFRSSADRLRFLPQNGTKVLASGRVDVYPQNGEYQLYVSLMEPEGLGALYAEFEKNKAKLEAEGLFDEKRKRPIPEFPLHIGVITSPSGAALQDILNITGRRAPWCDVTLYPSLVQGEGAALQLIGGIEYFNAKCPVDVIIIGRGGGSFEDLSQFNDISLAYAISASEIPVISAVGHETDFTICDFVSDKRAPTPSAAAELAVPDMQELLRALTDKRISLMSRIAYRLSEERGKLGKLKNSRMLTSYGNVIDEKRQRLDSLSELADARMKLILTQKRSALEKRAAMLNACSPLAVLARGYALLTKDDKSVSSVDMLSAGDKIRLELTDGYALATVDTTCKRDK